MLLIKTRYVEDQNPSSEEHAKRLKVGKEKLLGRQFPIPD